MVITSWTHSSMRQSVTKKSFIVLQLLSAAKLYLYIIYIYIYDNNDPSVY